MIGRSAGSARPDSRALCEAWAKAASAIFEQTLTVLRTADEKGISAAAAADHVAEERMAAAAGGGIWLPAR